MAHMADQKYVEARQFIFNCIDLAAKAAAVQAEAGRKPAAIGR